MTITLDRPWVRSIAAVTVGLTAAFVLPLVVHLIPSDGGPPHGARLLPIFFAGLVLVLRGAPVPALAVAVFAPLLNRLVTGMPAGPMLPTLLIELVLFTLLLALAVRYLPASVARFLGPVAYLAATLVARPFVFPGAEPLATLGTALTVGWPGLLMLLAVGALAGTGRKRAPASLS
jgi:hypothetical protein